MAPIIIVRVVINPMNITHHHCGERCPICIDMNCTAGEPIRCKDCDRLCRSETCFQNHKSVPMNGLYSICDRLYQCRDCSKLIERSKRPKDQHRCGETQCTSCKQFVPKEHRCYLRRKPAIAPSENLIFFDFESDQSTGEHVVNFAVLQYRDGSERVFSGYDACDQFCHYLFSAQHQNYTAIAHNLKGYDGQFILNWMLRQGLKPEVIPNGSKLMMITLPTLKIRLIDSFNFLPMALSKLPQTFGLTELKKGYFPHLFNTPDNQNYIGVLPAPEFYSYDTMSTQDREKFLQWYDGAKSTSFNFKEEMYAYCK